MLVEKITVKKLEAAKCQLHTAIKLWFADEDQISVHTLACASHQIVHDVNTDKKGSDLLLDSLLIRDEFRKEYVREMKKATNFFKHADKDPSPVGTVEFSPQVTELFILFTILGLKRFGERFTETTTAFLLFYATKNPNLIAKEFSDQFEVEKISDLPIVSKREFLDQFLRERSR